MSPKVGNPFTLYSGDFKISLSSRIIFGLDFSQKCVQVNLFISNYFYFLYWETRIVLYNIVQSKYLMNDKDLNAMKSLNISDNLNK